MKQQVCTIYCCKARTEPEVREGLQGPDPWKRTTPSERVHFLHDHGDQRDDITDIAVSTLTGIEEIAIPFRGYNVWISWKAPSAVGRRVAPVMVRFSAEKKVFAGRRAARVGPTPNNGYLSCDVNRTSGSYSGNTLGSSREIVGVSTFSG